MSIVTDNQFIEHLHKYLNSNDINIIITAFSKPVEGCNINRRTGRKMIGVSPLRYRKSLTSGSLLNYKSVILKFAKYKFQKIGRASSIDVPIVQQYNAHLSSNNRKHQTILTNLRILNRNVFSPILKQEIPMPQKNSKYDI